MQLTLSQPTANEMPVIAGYVKEFVLDDEGMREQQFIISKNNDQVVGFGRLKNHNYFSELCTLGVVTEYRGKGIGKTLVNELIKKAAGKHIYVVCIIPTYFQKFGFEISEQYPDIIKKKYALCTQLFVVEEEYCVMKYNAELRRQNEIRII